MHNGVREKLNEARKVFLYSSWLEIDVFLVEVYGVVLRKETIIVS